MVIVVVAVAYNKRNGEGFLVPFLVDIMELKKIPELTLGSLYYSSCFVVFVLSVLAVLTSKDFTILHSWQLSTSFLKFYLMKYTYKAGDYNTIEAYSDLYGLYFTGLSNTTQKAYHHKHNTWTEVFSMTFFAQDVARDKQVKQCASKMLLTGIAIWTILLKGCGAQFASKVSEVLKTCKSKKKQEGNEEGNEEGNKTDYVDDFVSWCLDILFVAISIGALYELDDTCKEDGGMTFSLDGIEYTSLDSYVGTLYWLIVVAACLDSAYILNSKVLERALVYVYEKVNCCKTKKPLHKENFYAVILALVFIGSIAVVAQFHHSTVIIIIIMISIISPFTFALAVKLGLYGSNEAEVSVIKNLGACAKGHCLQGGEWDL